MICVGFYTSWRPVSLVLTERRLLFCQPPHRAIFQVSLGDVNDVAIVKGRFILGLRRKLLRILLKFGGRYVAVNNPEVWMEAIMEAKRCDEADRYSI